MTKPYQTYMLFTLSTSAAFGEARSHITATLNNLTGRLLH